jgi:hypothetical protein
MDKMHKNAANADLAFVQPARARAANFFSKTS